MYSPTLGRWIETDPEQYVEGPNLYLFEQANPENHLDPNGTSSAPTTQPTTQPATQPSEPGSYVIVGTVTLPDGTVVVVREPVGSPPTGQIPSTQPTFQMPINEEAQAQLTLLRLWGNEFAQGDDPWSSENQCDLQSAHLMSFLRDAYAGTKPKLWDVQTTGGSTKLTNHNVVLLTPINGNPLPPKVLDSFHGPQHPFEKRQCKCENLEQFRKEYPNPVRKDK